MSADANFIAAVEATAKAAHLKAQNTALAETVKILTDMNIELNEELGREPEAPCPYSDEPEPSFREALMERAPWR